MREWTNSRGFNLVSWITVVVMIGLTLALVGITVRALNSVSDEVTLPQLRTLVVVSLQGPQTVSALAERVHLWM